MSAKTQGYSTLAGEILEMLLKNVGITTNVHKPLLPCPVNQGFVMALSIHNEGGKQTNTADFLNAFR